MLSPSAPDGDAGGGGAASAARARLLGAVRRADARIGAAAVPLQVNYRERHHAAGRIPGNRRRRDGAGPPSDREVLAARAVDRALRPWLLRAGADANAAAAPGDVVLGCEVQAYDPRPPPPEWGEGGAPHHADPTALAVNAAVSALYKAGAAREGDPRADADLVVPAAAAACVRLAGTRDGRTILDPTPREVAEAAWELLYAGTREEALMLEFAARGAGGGGVGIGDGAEAQGDPGIAEGTVVEALRLAHAALVPIIEEQERLRDERRRREARARGEDEALMTDAEVARLLGFELAPADAGRDHPEPTSLDRPAADDDPGARLLDEANAFVWSRVERVAMKLFGHDGADGVDVNGAPEGAARIHDGVLLPKKVRGRREVRHGSSSLFFPQGESKHVQHDAL